MTSPKNEITALIAQSDPAQPENAPPAEPFLSDNTPVDPVPIDLQAENAAYAELLALLNLTDDGDGLTLIVALSESEFEEETFTPATKE